MLKTIKIFIASSTDEFRQERNELGSFIGGINNKLIDKGIYCKLELCENEDNAMPRSARKQDEYNSLIKDADAVFVLFFKKCGEYTVEELKLAHNCFIKNGRPKVYTYFKNFDEESMSEELLRVYDMLTKTYHHFFCTFENIATVKVDILRVMFEITASDAARVRESGGVIYLGDEAVMQADELDYIKNSRAISALREKIAGLVLGDAKYTDGLFGDEISEEIERCEGRLRERYDRCFRALESRYASMSAAAKYDAELQAAYNASVRGDYDKVLEVLRLDKLNGDTRLEIEKEAASHRHYLDTTFAKYVQRINALTEMQDYEALEECYSAAVDAIEKLHLYEISPATLDLWYDFVTYLYSQNKVQQSLPLAQRLKAVYNLLHSESLLYDMAELNNLLGIIYDAENEPERAEMCYKEAIDVFENATPNSEFDGRLSRNLSMAYNNIAIFYDARQDFTNAEGYYLRALEIRKQNALRGNPEDIILLADLYANMSSFYNGAKMANEAEKYATLSVQIYEACSPERDTDISAKLAHAYLVLADFYDFQGVAENCKLYYERSLDIYENLYEKNPERFKPNLADIYSRMGNYFFRAENAPQECERYYLMSIKLYEPLAEADCERFGSGLAHCYSNIAGLYEARRREDAEEYYHRALSIRERLTESNPERFAPGLESSCRSIGSFHLKFGDIENAFLYLSKSVEISEALAGLSPKEFRDTLARSYSALAAVYAKLSDNGKSLELYERAVKIYEELAEESPKLYTENLGSAYASAASCHRLAGNFEKSEYCYMLATVNLEPLAKENPQRYAPAVSRVYSGAAILYSTAGQTDKAEDYHLSALKYAEQAALINPEMHAPSLANCYSNIGAFYASADCGERAEGYYLKAIGLLEDLVKKNPERHNAELAVTYWNLGLLLRDNEHLMQAFILAQSSLHNPQCRQIVKLMNGLRDS